MTITNESPEADVLSLFALLNSLLRRKRLVLGLPLLVLIIAAGWTLLSGTFYVSESKFTPHSSQGAMGGLTALAAQFGFLTGLTQSEEPPIDFYAELLRSQEFLGEVVRSRFRLPDRSERFPAFEGDLVIYYDIAGNSEQERLRRTVKHLRKIISIRKNPRANLVTIQVRDRSPDLAEQINRRLLESIDTFNLQKRQSQASEERRFVENRLQETLGQLNEAEDALGNFNEQNIGYENSATLRMEAARLQRRVDQHQQVYVSLAQAYEQARIDEVRDTPVITIVDSPEGWVRREGELVKNGVLGLLFGFIIAVGWIFGGEFIARQRQGNPEEYAEFIQLRSSFIDRRNRNLTGETD